MKLALITPTPLLRQYGNLPDDDYHLALAHLCSPGNDYETYYRREAKRGAEVILDNSVHENQQSVDTLTLAETAKRIGATTVVLPDQPFRVAETIKATEAANAILRELLPGVKLMGVPHGETSKGYLLCLQRMLQLDIDCVGLVRDCEQWGYDRADFILEVLSYLSPEHKVHVLGGNPHPELVHALGTVVARLGTDQVVGCDTTKPVVYALHRRSLDYAAMRLSRRMGVNVWPGRPKDYFSREYVSDPILRHNVKMYKSWLSGQLTYDYGG